MLWYKFGRFWPQKGDFYKILKTSIKQVYKPKMVSIGEETNPRLPKNWFPLKMHIFGTQLRRFWPQKGDFSKIIKTSTKQSYKFYKPNMVSISEEMHPALPENWFSLKMHIFGTNLGVFEPKKGIFPKSLKLPQNSLITSLQTKNGKHWWKKRSLHCLKTNYF